MYSNRITGEKVRTQTAAPTAADVYQINAAIDRLRAAYLRVLAEKRALENLTTAASEHAQIDAGAELCAVEKGDGESQQEAA